MIPKHFFSILCVAVSISALFFYSLNPLNLSTITDWRYGVWIAISFANFALLGKLTDDYCRLSKMIDEIAEVS